MSIKIERTNKDLSSVAGMVIFKDLLEKAIPDDVFNEQSLPQLKSGLERSIHKFKQLVLGFQAGAECLDDMSDLLKDSAFKEVSKGKAYSPKSFGDFLRLFDPVHCKKLNELLTKTAFSLRNAICPHKKSITIDIDSTTNEQHARKMEGVTYNYAGINGLDTIQAFDELGLQYWNDVRPGNTHTADGSLEIIHRIFSQMPESMNGITRYVRADSGFCKRTFFQACAVKQAQFVVCMRKLMYQPLIGKISNWRAQDEQDSSRILFKGSRPCEIGETTYQPKDSHLSLRAIVIRALKPSSVGKILLGESDYDYYGWVSNIDSMNSSEVIKFYRKRGNAENFIRELKNGMDLQHYPCQKLVANKAYGIIAAFAYCLMRFVALKDNPSGPKFAKAIRNNLVHLPCQVVRHAREVIFRFMDFHFEEVRKWIMEIKNLRIGPDFWAAARGG